MPTPPPDSPASDADADAPDFEAALAELEGLVGRMEGGELSLEDALAAFERGVHLTRTCQTALQAAEQRVQALVEGADGPTVTDFNPDSA